MNDALNFLGLIIAVWLFTTASAPIQWLKKILNVHPQTKSDSNIVLGIMQLINCSLCTGFWVGLGFYQNVLTACLLAFCSEVFCRLCQRFL